MSKAIARTFDTKLKHQPALSRTHNDILRLYPVASTSASSASASSSSGRESPALVPSLEHIQYYASDFDASPDALNAIYDQARKDAEQKYGERHVLKIRLSNKHHELKKYRRHDFRFTDHEKQRLQQHGVVVSERLGAQSFAELYYRLYTDDMPVYITSDSVLHAWHRSFDAFVVDLEMQELMPLLNQLLVKTLSAIEGVLNETAAKTKGDEFRAVLADVELYLLVAQRLLVGEPTAPPETTGTVETPATTSDEMTRLIQLLERGVQTDDSQDTPVVEPVPLRLDENEGRLETILAAVKQAQSATISLFGFPRDVDFSLFTPRGHYTKSTTLERFFRAMTWLGTIDLRIDGASDETPEGKASDLRQLQCAIVLVHLLRKAGVLPLVQTLHETIAAIAGDGVDADSMTPVQLSEVLGDHNRDLFIDFFGPGRETKLVALQDEIARRGLGVQAIAGHPHAASSTGPPTRPPTAFALVGQQFVWSAFVFSRLVDGHVVDRATNTKVPRRMVSAVDAAFALFGNNVAGELLAKRMAAPLSEQPDDEDFVAFRDGLPYAPNLIAMRELVDDVMDKAAADPSACSVALLWQLALRELSRPSTHGASVFQSATWQTRQMNTQIASFAQLRHDTMLYAKQGMTVRNRCEYPAVLVEPYPSFWLKMQQLAERTLAIVSALQLANAVDGKPEPRVQRQGRTCFENFATVCGKLAAIATQQAAKQPLSEADNAFLKNVMEAEHGSGEYRFLGWYPSLFYTSREDSDKQEHLVADIHTNAPSEMDGDPGGVLHLGVGNVNLAFVVVDDVMYAGPVFSHYEFVTPVNERLTDETFSARLSEFKAPRWARESFVVATVDDEAGVRTDAPASTATWWRSLIKHVEGIVH